jgi:tetratricopeptide (TPR) repeat protein
LGSTKLFSLSTITSAGLIALMLGSALWRLNDPPLQPRETSSLNLGMKRFGYGNYNLAYRSFRRTLSLNPYNTQALALSEILRVLGIPKSAPRYIEPTQEYSALTRMYPASPYLKLVGAQLFLNKGLPERVTALLLEKDVDLLELPHNWFILGLAQRSLGEKQAAIKSLLRAVDMHPQRRYFAALGETYFFNQDWESALENFRKAFSGERWELSSRFGYFRTLVYLEMYTKAIEFGQDLLTLLSENSRIPQKDHNKAKLIVELSSYKVVTDLSREQLLQYTQLLIDLAVDLANLKTIDAELYLSGSEKILHPALRLDLDLAR